jgi:uncharacterized protein (TIGR03000 family)
VIVFPRYSTTTKFAALTALGLLLPATLASAQQGWPILGSNWGFYGSGNAYRGGGGNGFRTRGYSSGSYGLVPAYSFAAPTYTYYSSPTHYPLQGQVVGMTYGALESNRYPMAAEAEGPRAAQITVRVPAGATIWFDDTPTSQTGPLRSFESSPLAPEKEYFYRVKVRWQEGGRDVTRTREVAVHAGDRLNLSFGPGAVAAPW